MRGSLDFAGGTGILRFGWIGSNAGSALAVNGQDVQAFMNTLLAAAAAAAGLAWALVEKVNDGSFTNLGVASGMTLFAIEATTGLRVSEDVEESGIDAAEHAESAYSFGETTMGRL